MKRKKLALFGMFIIAVLVLMAITVLGGYQQYNPDFGTFYLDSDDVAEAVEECQETHNLTMVDCVKSLVSQKIGKIGDERRKEKLQTEVDRILATDNPTKIYQAIDALEAIE